MHPASPAPPELRFLLVSEVAATMRVSKMTIYRLIHAGELEAVRAGRSFRIPGHAVTAYLRHAQYPGDGTSPTSPGYRLDDDQPGAGT